MMPTRENAIEALLEAPRTIVAHPIERETLSIAVFGPVLVGFQGRPVNLRTRKARAVLAYVALSETGQETRERLVGLFWSESEEHKARACLRQTLRELRQTFLDVGFRGLQIDKLTVELDRSALEVDFWSVIRQAEAYRAHPLLMNSQRAAETLLEGLDDLDQSFRVWLLAKRQTIQDRLLRGLGEGLRSDAADFAQKSKLAQAIINLDPTQEEACRYLMEVRAADGDIAGALGVYKELWNLLDEEYGMEPSTQTQELVARIKTGEIERLAPARVSAPAVKFAHDELNHALGMLGNRTPPHEAPATPIRVALAIEPFGMNGIDADKIHLVKGFHHHLVATLIRFREWYVTGRTAQADKVRPPIYAQYRVEATAYQIGAAVNLVLTLHEHEANLYVWSDQFELKLENWFEAQRRIVRRIAVSLNVHLSAERLMRLAGEPDVSLTVYDRWLRGQAMITRFHHADWNRASQIFADTIREAPGFSPGYSSLVAWNNGIHIAQPGIFRDPERARKNVELARTAVQLDALDSRAHLCLGWAYAMAKQYSQAEVHMDLARELNENDPWMLISSALFYAFRAKFESAKELADQAFEMALSPSLTHWAYLVSIRFLAGDYEGTVDAADRARDVIRTLRAWKAAALFHLGRRNEAHEEVERFLAAIKSFWFGSMLPTDETVARWLLHLYPISECQHWERLRDGLIGAGVPVTGIDHHGW